LHGKVVDIPLQTQICVTFAKAEKASKREWGAVKAERYPRIKENEP
jgi:hypothetical protein